MSYSTEDRTTFTSKFNQQPNDNPDRFIQWLHFREMQRTNALKEAQLAELERSNDLMEAQNSILTQIKNKIH